MAEERTPVVALPASLLPVHAERAPATGIVDASDLDPAIFPLLDALLHVHDAPSIGLLWSVTTDGRDLLLHFTGLVILLPEGRPNAASAPPLVETLLDHAASVTLVPGSAVTYGMLANDAPHMGTGSAIPLFLDPDGSLSSLPIGTLPPTFAVPETRMIGAFHVPLAFVDVAGTDLPARPASRTPDAIARQASDLARAGMPLREPVWIRAATGYRLVQPFMRRILVWDPLAGAVTATDVADVAQVMRLVSDGGADGAMLARLLLRLMSVEDSVGIAVAATTPRGTLTVSLRGAALYPAASVMKLAILAACEDGIARGELPRDADVDALEEAMIVYSDNEAANDLIDFAGRARINALLRRIGMERSYLGSHFDTAYFDDDDDNHLTPRESLLLMDALLRGTVGDATRIRDLLGRSEAPSEIREYHSTKSAVGTTPSRMMLSTSISVMERPSPLPSSRPMSQTANRPGRSSPISLVLQRISVNSSSNTSKEPPGNFPVRPPCKTMLVTLHSLDDRSWRRCDARDYGT